MLATRITSMENERDDLIAAIGKLRAAISQLNREGRERLLKSFGDVNEHFKPYSKSCLVEALPNYSLPMLMIRWRLALKFLQVRQENAFNRYHYYRVESRL